MVDPFAGAPRANQLADQAPLRPARVLELVDQDVLVPRLEPVAAARELFHLPEQLERALEQIRKIEDAVLVERASILVLRNREQPARAASQHEVDVALERVDRRLDVGAQSGDDDLVPLVIGRRSELRLGVRGPLARLAGLGQHQLTQSIEHRP